VPADIDRCEVDKHNLLSKIFGDGLCTEANARRGLKLNPCSLPASFEHPCVAFGRWQDNRLLAPDE
jgi:hypothetical protein